MTIYEENRLLKISIFWSSFMVSKGITGSHGGGIVSGYAALRGPKGPPPPIFFN